MTEGPTEFAYHMNIELYKSESLGSGSYGRRRRMSVPQLYSSVRSCLSLNHHFNSYTESVHQAESSDGVEQLELQLRGQKILTETKIKREAVEHREQILGLERAIKDKDRKLQAKDGHYALRRGSFKESSKLCSMQ